VGTGFRARTSAKIKKPKQTARIWKIATRFGIRAAASEAVKYG
jgi:hypothetical protein